MMTGHNGCIPQILRFKDLRGTATVMDTHVAYHQAYDLLVTTLDIIKLKKNNWSATQSYKSHGTEEHGHCSRHTETLLGG